MAIRRCPKYSECLVATTVDERRYCPTHGDRLVAIERTCPACGAGVLPDDRFCGYCGAAQDPATSSVHPDAAPSWDATPNEETCLVYDWLFRQRNGVRARLDQAIAEARAREPEDVRAAMRVFVRTGIGDVLADTDAKALRDTLADVALDRVDWDQLVEDYFDRERRDVAEDRVEEDPS